jgi:uncharacterized membrane protein
MKVTKAPATSVLARAAILFAALSALCLLLAGCAPVAPAAAAGAQARYVYYVAPAGSGAGSCLRRLGIPAGCRVG